MADGESADGLDPGDRGEEDLSPLKRRTFLQLSAAGLFVAAGRAAESRVTAAPGPSSPAPARDVTRELVRYLVAARPGDTPAPVR